MPDTESTTLHHVRRRPGWTAIDNGVFRAGMSARAIGVFCLMQSKPPAWEFSAARIAKEVAEGRDAILTAIRELRDVGFVALRRIGGAEPRSVYYMRDALDLAWPWDDPQPDNPTVDDPPPENPGVGTPTPSERTVTAMTEAVITEAPITAALEMVVAAPDAPTVEQSFDQLWKHYPRHIAKPAALKSYRAVRKHTDHDSIMRGLATWCAYWTAKNEPQFIPHPATWLNQHRWNDTPPAIVRRAGQTDVHAGLAGMRFDDAGRLIDNP